MNFIECVLECARNEALVAEFNRLAGCKLGQSTTRTLIEKMVDDATGYAGESNADMAKFVDFVRDAIWLRLPTVQDKLMASERDNSSSAE